jgi:hypothetical protein
MSAKALLAAFEVQVDELVKTSDEADQALSKKTVSTSSRDSVVELVHLRATSLMEAFVEDLFFELVSGLSGLASVTPVLAFPNPEMARTVLIPQGKFPAWLDFDETRERADPLLTMNPFNRLRYRPVEKSLIRESTVVRNAIAHNSGTAKTKFDALVMEKSYVAHRPADYLLSQRGGQAEGTLALRGMVLIGKALTANSDSAAFIFLNPERAFTSDEKPEGGDFECVSCSTIIAHPGLGRLGICPTCAPSLRCATCNTTRNSTWRIVR